jgi:putative ABC transport system permease protein
MPPQLFRSLLRPIRGLWRRERIDSEIDEEIRFHVDLRTQENIRAGMDHGEARAAALRSFGNSARVKEMCREERGVGFLEPIIQDLAYGARMLKRHPGFSVIALLTLALGIGVNSAIFSVVYAVLIHPFPFKAQDRLVVALKMDQAANNSLLELSYPEYQDWKEQNRVFEQLAVMPTTTYGYGFTMIGEGEPAQI